MKKHWMNASTGAWVHAATCAILFGVAGQLQAADSPPTQSTPPGYQRSETSIAMRDGMHLDTVIWSPDDTSARYPILLVRSPYDLASAWMAPEPQFLAAGYIFVFQSVRGRYKSEGHFVHMAPHLDLKRTNADVDASSDTYDTIDWLVKNVPNNNGRVGLRGVSYNGFYAAAGMIDAHPALLAVSPQAPQTDWFLGDDVHHNGAFMLASAYSWLKACDRASDGVHTCAEMAPPDPNGYRYFLKLGPLANADAQYFHGDSPEWKVLMTHGTYDDLWKQRSLPIHLRNIKPAVLVVSGWYDASNLYGALRVFDAVRTQSPATQQTLVLGPWVHGQWADNPGHRVGPLDFGADTATDFITQIQLPFFESHLKGGDAHLPVARMFDTGRKEWRSFDSWPPKSAQTRMAYLESRRSLGFDAPAPAASPPRAGDYDQYVSDPMHPVPFLPDHGFDMDADYMAHDQRFASSRHDVVTYRSRPLTEDVSVVGPIRPHLTVSTTGTDSDWVVKVIDVHPADGFEELVRGDVMRAKFRDSFASPTAMVPGEPTKIDFVMPDVYHTFRKGHRIVVEVQSSWFPLIDRNPQRFLDIYTATASDFQSATQRIYHSADLASRVEFAVLAAAE